MSRPRVLVPSDPALPDVPFQDETPIQAPWRERFLHVFASITLAWAAFYLGWRWTATLNPEALWISVPLALAETAAVLLLAGTVFNVWRLPDTDPPAAPEGLSVDVFITTYDEPIEVIRKTAMGAKAIRYPHRTFILDDGRRIELARMARELGVAYITRDDNRNAKAGNLNNALVRTSGEFILQLDADHIPLPHILDRLLGYMLDPGVAFVQAPQNFYNNDAFGTHLNRETGRLLTDQNIFFYALQPGKSRLNATFFCGSCAVLRRSAIEEIGGFAAQTITEDIETSLLLHGRGWRSIYHNETLAYGLAPRTFHGFSVQRSRWAKGGMQMLRKYNPLTLPGLTVAQRLSYLSANLHALEGPIRLVFILAPLAFLLGDVYAVHAWGPAFFARFVPFVILTLALHQLVARGRSGPIWFLEMIATAKMFAHTASFAAFFTSRQLRFRVTPKGLEDSGWRVLVPFVALLLVTLAALARGAWVFSHEAAAWGVRAADPLAYSLNLGWAAWNACMLALVIRAGIRSLQRRPAQRFEEFLPFRLRLVPEAGAEGPWITAITENLHEDGLAFRSLDAVSTGARIRIILPLAHDEIAVTGRVVHRRPSPVGGVTFVRHGVAFEDPPQPVRDAISLHCTQHAVPAIRHLYIEQQDPFTEGLRRLRDARADRRDRVLLPAVLSVDGAGETLAVLEDTSRGGACVLLDTRPARGSRITWHVPGTALRGAGTVIHARRIVTPLGERWAAGIAHDAAATDAVLLPMRPRLRLIERTAMIAALVTTLKRFSIALLTAGVLAVPAHAQTGWLAGGEAAGDGESMVLLGGWIGATSGSLRPVLGFITYRLAYEEAAGDIDVWTANPFVGLRHQRGPNGVQASVGWAFQNESVPAGQRRVTDGFTTTLQIERAGPVATAASALATYSWGDGGYFWSRGRLSQQIAGGDTPRLRLGVETTAQSGAGYKAVEVGPLLEWLPPGIASLAVSGGVRHARPNGFDTANNAFFRLELVIIP